MLQHTLGDMADNIHNGLITGSAFSQVRDHCVTMIMPTPGDFGFLPDVVPGGLESGHGSGGIARTWFPKREDEPARFERRKLLFVPLRVFIYRFRKSGIQRNSTAFASLSLALSYSKVIPF